MGQPYVDFQADAATVIANQPDFVTYNEVPYRYDVFLAPPGYALWRTPGSTPARRRWPGAPTAGRRSTGGRPW